jgi:membrane protein YdbS with pleckstrin-like domain
MADLQLFQEEELFMRFRPHPMSFLGHYVFSFGWLVAGMSGAVVGILVQGTLDRPSVWALLALMTVGLLGGAIRQKARRGSMAYSWFAILVCALVIGVLFAVNLPDEQPWLPAVGLGVLLSAIRLVGWELMRIQRVHFLTSQRLVLRAGLGHRQEETLPLAKIQEVRSQVGPLGQVFNFGDLILGLGHSGRGKNAKEDTWVLAGVARMSDVKHQLDELLEEMRLPIKERRRRVEERRLRESMRRLAGWMRRDRTQSGPSV